MPSIEEIIEGEIHRIAKKVMRTIAEEWLEKEADEKVRALAEKHIKPFISIFSDQKHIIQAMQEQMEMLKHPDAVVPKKRTRGKGKDTQIKRADILKITKDDERSHDEMPPDTKEPEIPKIVPSQAASELPTDVNPNFHKRPCFNKERIRNIRIKRGLTEGQLALLLGVPDFTIKLWEDGIRKPEPYQKTQLAALRDMKKALYHALLRKYNIVLELPEK